MAEIRPFKGLRFQAPSPDQLGQCACPPYDMLDKAMIDALYDKDEHNTVRIIQNRPQQADSRNKDRHIRAAKDFKAWVADGAIGRDDEESLYVYRQKFSADLGAGIKEYIRTGITCRVRLVDFSENIVYPHEKTLSGPKVDRYELLEATNVNTGQIFGLVPDEGDLYAAIDDAVSGNVLGFFVDSNDVRHEIYRTSDRQKIEALQQLIADRSIVIADGHHRYETALKYAKDNGAPDAQYLMMTLVSMADPGLIIRPFHRLIQKNALSQKFHSAQQLAAYFDMTDMGDCSPQNVVDFMSGKTRYEMLWVDSPTKHSYGLVLNDGGKQYLADHDNGQSEQWNAMSVSQINRFCVEALMQQPLDGTILHDVIDYVNDAQAAYERAVSGGNYSGCFFIHPLKIETIKSIVSSGERMPQKSTNFYPKLYSGLVFNSLDAQ